jgi:crotonobetainyl-CoA:carnitine CoA-transferase CaiB-like acyl-CoA transferase
VTLAGLTVVEVAIGVSELGLGHAGAVPGWLFAGLGAEVTRVVGPTSPGIDAGVEWGRVWHRQKRIARTDDPAELLRTADVAFVYGDGAGLDRDELLAANPRLVHVRCEGEFALLTEAASGFCSQLAAHRDGPMLVDARAASSGAAFLQSASALALLRRRALTGVGGWAETSLYDGMLATLGCMIGRSERAAPKIEQYWREGSYFPNFLYRCGDGELIQVWFGGKGMYAAIIDVLGDEPSEDGYYAEQVNGLLQARAERWKAIFPTRPRAEWVELIRAAGVACEEVLGPGEALAEPHLAEVGLAVRDGDDVVPGVPIAIEPLAPRSARAEARTAAPSARRTGERLLEGVKVADFSAFVAGPLAAEVLADLGAEVIKVEPPEGEAMRAAAYAIAACQRGKRSIGLDIGAPDARPVVEALLGWADVVLHNFRVGVAERLGIDEATVARLNPGAVYCHASAFGASGPRAKFPGNDALMQALTGFEVAIGGEGNEPTAATWIPIDMTGGWLAATGILAGLYRRAATGEGQRVGTSLLGAGMLLHSGVFLRDGEVVRGPALGADQTGYGPGYRLYETSDGWLALVVPDEAAWSRLRALVPDLPADYRPLDGPADALERAFVSAPAAEWAERLGAADVPAAVALDLTRDEFRSRILADPLRTASYTTDDWGAFEQIGPLLRCGPDAGGGPELMLPGVGQHTVEVLRQLGFDDATVESLLDAKVARQR